MTLAAIRLSDPTAAWAIARTLPLEGGLVDNPHDPGGITAYGVSLRYALAQVQAHPDSIRFLDLDHDGHVDRDDIVGMTPDQAAEVYFRCWWQPGWYGRLTPALVAWKCFDVAVNTGPKRAALILQKALNQVGEHVAQDAVVGAQSVGAVARQARADNGLALMGALRTTQADFYRSLARRQPDLGAFLDGWMNRAAA